jgi:hypothetical protein
MPLTNWRGVERSKFIEGGDLYKSFAYSTVLYEWDYMFFGRLEGRNVLDHGKKFQSV